MISVDEIKFVLRAADEGFVHGLYAGWDDFCRHCVDPVIDEVFAPYDRGNSLIVVPNLDLDLGTIPQEDFHRLFPIRLREELRRQFVLSECAAAQIRELFAGTGHLIRQSDGDSLAGMLGMWLESPDVTRDDKRRQLRLFAVTNSNLLWLLLEKLDRHAAVFRELSALLGPELLLRPGVTLTRRQEEVRRRTEALFPHEDVPAAADKNLLSGMLAASTSHERRRCLAAALEADPAEVLRVIRDTEDPATLRMLAGMLDDAMVARIVAEECRDHAEVDMSAYWKSLYDWLLRFYPTVGSAYFGSERQFREEVNQALLSVIRRRRGAVMLSKGELTALFMTEIFGRERYPQVLERLAVQSGDMPAEVLPPGFRGSEQHAGISHLAPEVSLLLQTAAKPGKPEMPADDPAYRVPATPDGGRITNPELPHSAQERHPVPEAEAEREMLSVSNAGLVLLAPWFSRLFSMLGLLCEDRTAFRDEQARVRAVFVIQRLVTFEEREYRGPELVFNRLLTGCPFSTLLPRTPALTDEEIRVTDSMLTGVMTNWPKMNHTSQPGFQRSFIERGGYIEEHEQALRLTVEPRAYDLLLDTLPWAYKMLRLPWLGKTIYVEWR